MENKKLINILIKDMQDLEELIAEIKNIGEYNLLAMEILQTKAGSIKNLLSILKASSTDVKTRNPIIASKPEGKPIVLKNKEGISFSEEQFVPAGKKEVVEIEKKPEAPNVEEKINEIEPEPAPPVINEEEAEPTGESTVILKEEAPAPIKGSPTIPGAEKEEGERMPAEEEEPVMDSSTEENAEVELQEEEEPAMDSSTEENAEVELQGEEEPAMDSSTEENTEVELQEEEAASEPQVLGDKLQAGKSLNDIMPGDKNIEQKISELPLTSIRSSIGINDRFLYTRELFDGDANRFAEAVNKLDGFDNINQAVVYLRGNFKWKKNDTSLKFIDLVKRRYMNG